MEAQLGSTLAERTPASGPCPVLPLSPGHFPDEHAQLHEVVLPWFCGGRFWTSVETLGRRPAISTPRHLWGSKANPSFSQQLLLSAHGVAVSQTEGDPALQLTFREES